ncbi:universal stress protein [Microbispora sp. ATCC PTA-5024]|uniref:universal stress protein n=1 Tax=Microbispora sp. ATCC PTA-5024 TaxID=316330 RepID=UPI0004004E43|nr:universal stress protein [Microbispora sp. ATCC PTA-5024]
MTMPIVVGADGSPASLQAAEWAGHEAVVREASLWIVHVPPRWSYGVPLVPQPGRWAAAVQAEGRRILEEATIRARAGARRLRVDTAILEGVVPETLVAAAGAAQLIVVGDRGRGGFAGLLLGSVARHVAARAPCPVAVIRQAVGQAETGDHGEIVVGVTGRPDQEPVLDFAFQEAFLRKARLRAVRAWTHPTVTGPGDARPLFYDVEEVTEQETRSLAATLATRAGGYPGVPVTRQVVHEHPAKALIDASATADLLIIGVRLRTPAVLGLGAVAHAVLHHCACPVVAVRH